MVIRDQRHASTTLLATFDVAPPNGRGLNRSVHKGMNTIENVKVYFKDSQSKCKYIKMTLELTDMLEVTVLCILQREYKQTTVK